MPPVCYRPEQKKNPYGWVQVVVVMEREPSKVATSRPKPMRKGLTEFHTPPRSDPSFSQAIEFCHRKIIKSKILLVVACYVSAIPGSQPVY